MSKISVIIPAYNAEKYIKRCMKSIIKQTYKNLQIIVINDGSTDNTKNIIKQFMKIDKRIELINISNNGVSNARNIGVEHANGDYITFVDSDDYIEQNMYEELYCEIKNKNVDVVRCNNYINYEISGKIEVAPYYDLANSLLEKKDIKEKFLDNILVRLPCYVFLLLVKSEIAKKIKFDTNIRILEDKLYYCQLIANIDKLYCLNENLYHYCINNDSATNRKDKYEYYLDDLIRFVDKTIEILRKKNMLTNDVYVKIKNMYITVIDRYLYNIYKMYGIEKVKYLYENMQDSELLKNIEDVYSKKYIKKNKLDYRFTTIYLINKNYKRLNKKYKIYRYYEPISNNVLKLKVFIKKWMRLYGKKRK